MSVAFFEPYNPYQVPEVISMNMGTGGPPPRNKKLNNATNTIVPPKTKYARNTFFYSLSNFSLHKIKISRPTPI